MTIAEKVAKKKKKKIEKVDAKTSYDLSDINDIKHLFSYLEYLKYRNPYYDTIKKYKTIESHFLNDEQNKIQLHYNGMNIYWSAYEGTFVICDNEGVLTVRGLKHLIAYSSDVKTPAFMAKSISKYINKSLMLPWSCVFAPDLCKQPNNAQKPLMILNGDNDFYKDKNYTLEKPNVLFSQIINAKSNANTNSKEYDFFLYVKNSPTVSFICIARLLNLNSTVTVCELLSKGTIKVLDYTADKRIKLSKAETRKITELMDKNKILYNQAVNMLNPPEKGFSIVGQHWHRSSTFLFSHKNKHYIIGQDEGTYFGCELEGKPLTVSDAYDDLIPAEIRGKKGVLRQGEWFAVPVSSKEFPNNIKEYIECHEVILPREDKDSNKHILSIADFYSQSNNDIRIHNGNIYVKGRWNLSHEDHAEMLSKKGFYRFYRNTAIQSVSLEGVD